MFEDRVLAKTCGDWENNGANFIYILILLTLFMWLVTYHYVDFIITQKRSVNFSFCVGEWTMHHALEYLIMGLWYVWAISFVKFTVIYHDIIKVSCV